MVGSTVGFKVCTVTGAVVGAVDERVVGTADRGNIEPVVGWKVEEPVG